jgi:hypothetical protein
MSRLLWLIGGVAAGFVAAHQLSKTEQGKAFFDTVDAKAKEFGEAVAETYKAQEANLKSALSNVESAIKDLSDKASKATK